MTKNGRTFILTPDSEVNFQESDQTYILHKPYKPVIGELQNLPVPPRTSETYTGPIGIQLTADLLDPPRRPPEFINANIQF